MHQRAFYNYMYPVIESLPESIGLNTGACFIIFFLNTNNTCSYISGMKNFYEEMASGTISYNIIILLSARLVEAENLD